jgi:hypothetical protein
MRRYAEQSVVNQRGVSRHLSHEFPDQAAIMAPGEILVESCKVLLQAGEGGNFRIAEDTSIG